MRWPLLLFCLSGLFAQGTDPKSKAEDYEAHGQSKGIAIGAEFMLHSFSGQGTSYIAPDYLVVEVALYPPKGEEIELHAAAFSLRLNGKRNLLTPVTADVVKGSLERPEWQQSPHLDAAAGVGNATVILAGPHPGQTPRTGTPYPVPRPGDGDVPRTPPVKAEDLVTATALPEGRFRAPASGYIYFPYTGRVHSLKTVELMFEDTVVKLR